jgi:hypothetical protein
MKSTLFAMVVCMAGGYGIIGLIETSWNPALWEVNGKAGFLLFELIALVAGVIGSLAIAKLKKPKQ